MTLRQLRAVLIAGVVATVYLMVSPSSTIRLLAFIFGCSFLIYTLQDAKRRLLMLRFGAAHAAIVLFQLTLVLLGVELDFSLLLRSVYGELLPPTGIHIDYNAFSQFDIFLPRVAGLNREPAFGCILFLCLCIVGIQARRRALTVLLGAATLATLSKVLFPILAAFVLGRLLSTKASSTPPSMRYITKAGAFLVLNMIVLAGVKLNIELVEAAMVLDASFFHRIVGFYALAEQAGDFRLVGGSQDLISAAHIYSDYEFRNEPRAFLDGSVVSKVVVDFGSIAAGVLSLAVAWFATSWAAAAALAVAGLFINFLSLSPATILLFVLLCFASARAKRNTRPSRRLSQAVRPSVVCSNG